MSKLVDHDVSPLLEDIVQVNRMKATSAIIKSLDVKASGSHDKLELMGSFDDCAMVIQKCVVAE